MDNAKKLPISKNIAIGVAALAMISLLVWNFQISRDLGIARAELENKIERIEDLEDDKANLENELGNERVKIAAINEQVEDLSDDVDVLNKLSKTDEELLQKYSKVSFLNEHYVPSNLRELGERYTYNEKEIEVHSKIITDLREMIRDAEDEDIELKVVSGYRSFGTQSELKSAYLVTYGSGANAFSADQGFSEHQLGTAVDFTTESMNGALEISFEDTPEYEWLIDNAHLYGFTLSYPRGNAYYQFEPWHWRYVGDQLARNLHNRGKYFYDLDQREIDEYLIEIFD